MLSNKLIPVCIINICALDSIFLHYDNVKLFGSLETCLVVFPLETRFQIKSRWKSHTQQLT